MPSREALGAQKAELDFQLSQVRGDQEALTAIFSDSRFQTPGNVWMIGEMVRARLEALPFEDQGAHVREVLAEILSSVEPHEPAGRGARIAKGPTPEQFDEARTRIESLEQIISQELMGDYSDPDGFREELRGAIEELTREE